MSDGVLKATRGGTFVGDIRADHTVGGAKSVLMMDGPELHLNFGEIAVNTYRRRKNNKPAVPCFTGHVRLKGVRYGSGNDKGNVDLEFVNGLFVGIDNVSGNFVSKSGKFPL